MANVTLNNTANMPGTFYLGIDNPELSPEHDPNKTGGEALSYQISNFISTYELMGQELQLNGVNGWTVDGAFEVPAGTKSMTLVSFEKTVNGVQYELSLVGNLVSSGNRFTLTGSSGTFEIGDGVVDFKSTAPWTIQFEQRDSGKVYDTQLDFYNGNPSQSPTMVGALPSGAVMTGMSGGGLTNGQTGVPNSLSQIGVETSTGEFLTITGSFVRPYMAQLEGNVTTVQSLQATDSGVGADFRTWTVSNGAFRTDVWSGATGIFTNPSASIALTRLDRSEGPVQFNFDTMKPELPAAGVSTVVYTQASVPLSAAFATSETLMYSGNDVFKITSSTDTVVEAGGGNDTVDSGSGNDIINGGKGNDVLNGGAGNDFFVVNQNEGFGEINSFTYGVAKQGAYTVNSATLGHDLIHGGSGLDTVGFAPPDTDWLLQPGQDQVTPDVNPSPVQAGTPPSNTSFSYWAGPFDREVTVDLNEFPSTDWWLGQRQTNKFGVSVLELQSKEDDVRKLVVVDTVTNRVLAERIANDGEKLLQGSASGSTTFYTSSLNNANQLTINGYGFGLNTSYSPWSVLETKTFNMPAGVANGYFDDFVSFGGLNNGVSFGFFNPNNDQQPFLYRFTPTLGVSTVELPFFYTNSNTADWLDMGFFNGPELWLKVNSEFTEHDAPWTQTYLAYNTSSGGWRILNDSDNFWDAWNVAVGRESVIRLDNGGVFDLSELGGMPNGFDDTSVFDLPDGKKLVILDVLDSNMTYNVGYERWIVIDQNGIKTADKSFSTSPLGLSQRTFGNERADDGHLYFQQLNLTFNARGEPVQANTATAVSLYKIPLGSIESVLQAAASPSTVILAGVPGVYKVQDFSQSQLTGRVGTAGQVVIIQEYLDAAILGGSTSVALVNRVDFNTGANQLFLDRIDATGKVSMHSFGSFDNAWLESYVVHQATGELFVLFGTEDQGDLAYEVNLNTGVVRAISMGEFDDAAINIPDMADLTHTLQTNLQLVLPAGFYGDQAKLPTQDDVFVSSTGLLGVREEWDEGAKTQAYFQLQAPTDGSIGILYENSYSGEAEYLHLKDVEFIELMGADGNLNIHDIRPLYLASKGNDTLYAMTHKGLEGLSTVFNNSPGDPTDNPVVFDDAMRWYRDQFAVITTNDGTQEWRYYLNAGAGNDTLHGTKDEGFSSVVHRVQFDSDTFGNGSVTFRLTHPDHPDQMVSLQKNASWSEFNKDMVTSLTHLNLGIVVHRGKDNREVIFSGLETQGWTLEVVEEGVTVSRDDIHDAGRDALDGGAGADVMIGYSGNDTYFVDNVGDKVIESAWDTGFDQVLTNITYALDGDSAVERLSVHQIIEGASGYLAIEPRATAPALSTALVNLTGNNYTRELMGHDGANIIKAGQQAGARNNDGTNTGALMLGMGGADRLEGSDRNDHFLGGLGNDILVGGLGDDSFYMGFALTNEQLAVNLLPSEDSYSLLDLYGFRDNPFVLTGGDDVAIGGDGFDTVVVGAKSNDGIPGVDTSVWLQRISDTQIKLFTLFDSMTVDNTVEAIKYELNGVAQTQLLPWVVSMDERTRDRYYESQSGMPLAYAAPSKFSDLVDLSFYPGNGQDGVMSAFDAGDGNDVVYGGWGLSAISAIRGGAGDDWVYGGQYTHENDAWRYELYGDAGNDTLTVSYSDWAAMPLQTVQVLLDGGVGNDHYRLSVADWQQGAPQSHVRIEDAGGVDRLTLANGPDDENTPDIHATWDSGELRFMRVDRDENFNVVNRSVMMSAAIGAIDQLFFTGDGVYFDGDTIAGGTLVNPNALALSTGKLVGTAGNDVLLPLSGVRLEYDGGAGDDLIIMNDVKGGVVSGGAGNNRIIVDRLNYNVQTELTLSYVWTPAGASAEVDLANGYGYVVNPAGGLLATDSFSMGELVNVLGGAAHEIIRGSALANRLDGGAGNDVLYSGRNLSASSRDVLMGGAGDDILIDETYWGFWGDWQNISHQGSLMEGGAGNDTYVIQHNSAPPSSGPGNWITPTKIVERNPNGTDSGGVDTIRFVSSSTDIEPDLNFVQTGRVIRVELTEPKHSSDVNLSIGDVLILGFASGPTQTNGFAVTKKITQNIDGQEFLVALEFEAPNVGNQVGKVMVRDPGIDGMMMWADVNTLALFSTDDADLDALNDVQNGQNMIHAYDGHRIQSDLNALALVDRNALDILELSAADPLNVGLRMPISFNQGRSTSLELVMAGSNGNAVLFGGAGSDYILDTSYRDILIGGDGHDVLTSNFGSDVLLGGAGNDGFIFRADGQVMVGGVGADTFMLKGMGLAPATITDFKPWEGDRLMLDETWLENLAHQESWDLSTLEVQVNSSAAGLDVYLTYQSFNSEPNNMNFTPSLMNIVTPADGDMRWDQELAVRDQLEASLAQWRTDTLGA